MIESIFDGQWNTLDDRQRPVNYWWGLSSGVIDVDINDELPQGAKHLARILMDGVTGGSIDPFGFRMVDQHGNVRSEGDRQLTYEEMMNMDWLLDNVEGHIPAYEELLPVSQQLVRHLGLYRDQIPPEPEEVF